MNNIFKFVLAILLLSCSSLKKNNCELTSFDHLWLKVPDSTFNKIGKSDYFSKENFSFFEPFKSPKGTYKGHYINGNEQYLEIFNKGNNNPDRAFGIGFYNSNPDCFDYIETKISPKFNRSEDQDWGKFMDLKFKDAWYFVYEPSSNYLNIGEDKSRSNYLRKIREKADNYKRSYNFNNIEELVLESSNENLSRLSEILLSLGWKRKSDNTYTDGLTTIKMIVSSRQEIKVYKIILKGKSDININNLKVNKFLIENTQDKMTIYPFGK